MIAPRTTVSQAALTYEAATVSRRGRNRTVNEDVVDVRVRNSPDGRPVGYALVCDGLGGYEAGEIASRLAVRVMRKVLVDSIPALEGPGMENAAGTTLEKQPDEVYLYQRISGAIRSANEQIYRFSRENEEARFPHSGTAMTMAALFGSKAIIAHVGNSRLYRYRNGELNQLTHDHTIIAELIQAGVLRSGKARLHPQRNILTRALGTRPQVQADMRTTELSPGDRLLLCSNGLWTSFTHDLAIAGILERDLPPDLTAAGLVRIARSFGGDDDLSAVVVDIRRMDQG